MADKITFSGKINDSVQVGDELYYTNISTGTPDPTTPILLGTILDKGEKWVKVDPTSITGYTQSNPNLITNGGFDSGYGTNNVPCVNSLGQCVTFDVNLSGWSMGAAATGDHFYHATASPHQPGQNSAGNALDGSNRLYVDDIGTNQHTGFLLYDILGLEVGKLYRFSFDYEMDVGSGLTVKYHNMPSPGYDLVTGTGTYTGMNTNILGYGGPGLEPYIMFYGSSGVNGNFGYVDNVKVEEVLPANNWYVTGWDDAGTHYKNWNIIGNGTAEHNSTNDPSLILPPHADFLNQDLIIDTLLEGEEYRLEMEIVGGSPATGDIKIANAATGGADVDVEISSTEGTATWIQGTTNLDKIRIWQDDTGDAEIDNVTLHMISFDLATALGGVPPENLFFMFRKPVDQNVSGLKGYYAEVTLTNSSTEKQELFAVGSEVFESSK